MITAAIIAKYTQFASDNKDALNCKIRFDLRRESSKTGFAADFSTIEFVDASGNPSDPETAAAVKGTDSHGHIFIVAVEDIGKVKIKASAKLTASEDAVYELVTPAVPATYAEASDEIVADGYVEPTDETEAADEPAAEEAPTEA